MFKSMLKTIERFKKLKGANDALGNMAVNHFKQSFHMQRFNENGSEKWAEVQRRIPGTKAYKYATRSGRSNPILRGKGSGRLAKSITYKRRFFSAVVYVAGDAANYGAVHNNGLGRQKRRHYMGTSKTLRDKQKKYIRDLLRK